MRSRTAWLSSVGLGAATAFLFDPASGKRRRRRVGDLVAHAVRAAEDGARTVGRDLRNRTRGVVASVRRRGRHELPNDTVLCERVRATLGRVAAYPHSIDVDASDGKITLRGPIPASEKGRVVSAIQSVAGVRYVDTRFDSHTQRASAASHQGSAARQRIQLTADILQRNWAPSTRAIVAAAGAVMVVIGATRRSRIGLGLAAAGAALAARALTTLPFRTLAGRPLAQFSVRRR